MFVILFAIYAITFFKKKSIYRIFLEVLPSTLLVFSGFYLFYVGYCDFFNSDVCWPIRQSRDLVFPVFVNIPVICSLIVLVLFPVLVRREVAARKLISLNVIFIIGIIVLMETYGSKKILSEKEITGGGIYKFRELFGSFSIFFDVISIGLFFVLTSMIFRMFKRESWIYQSLIVIVLSSIFGPYAFQRYFEPYILILGSIFLAINSKNIFSTSKFSVQKWAVFLVSFQILESVASIFIRV
jgi:hypothetical protein